MQVEEQTLITAVKGLTRRVNIKEEHLQIINQALEYNNFTPEQWDNILNRNNINFALKDKIYTMEMVRLLTLRAIVNPNTIIEYFTWLNEGKKSKSDNIYNRVISQFIIIIQVINISQFINKFIVSNRKSTSEDKKIDYSLDFQKQINKIILNSNSLSVIRSQLKQGINIIIDELKQQNKMIKLLKEVIPDKNNLWKDSLFVLEKTLAGHSNSVNSVAFSPDDQYFG